MTASSAPMQNDQPLPLLSLAGYQRFGEYLRVKRQQLGLTQQEMGEMFPTLSRQTYGYLERERRAPQVEELVPLFAALVELHTDLHLPPMQAIEAQTFFRLSKAAIEHKQRKRQALSKEQWAEIEQQLIAMTSNAQRGSLRLIASHGSTTIVEAPDSRRRRALENALHTDISSLLERETWVQQVISLLNRTPHIKVSVYQGGMGAGKSHALALLIQQFAARGDLFLIPYTFEPSETMTCEDHLDVFLATLYADLTFQAIDDTKQRPIGERIKHTLAALYAFEKPVVLLLDDVQEIFPSASEWSPSWHQFFSAFITEPHKVSIYLMTRTWPGWDERKLSFLHEDYLPELSPEAGMQIWKRRGFDDVENRLLRAVCDKCGTNPQVIEMLTFQYRRRGYIVQFGKDAATSTQENTNTRNLKKLLASDTLFSNYLDATARRTLQQVFSNRFSGETRQVLEWLAVSPLALPFHILFDQVDFSVDAYEALRNASYVDLAQATSHRATLVPLVREAVLQSLTPERRTEAEQEVLKLYTFWLQEGQEFKDEREQAALIAEIAVQHMKQLHLLRAAEFVVEYGWLGFAFGHGPRLARIANNVMTKPAWRDGNQNEIGGVFLYHFLGQYAGRVNKTAIRAQDYHHILTIARTKQIVLNVSMEIHLLHYPLLAYLNANQFGDAQALLNEASQQFLPYQGSAAYIPFLSDIALFWGAWADYAEAQGDMANEILRREQAIAVHQQAIALLEQQRWDKSSLAVLRTRKDLARQFNNLSYHLIELQRHEEAIPVLRESIEIKRETHALPYSIAAGLGELAVALLANGRYQEALIRCEEALQLVQCAADEGNSIAYAELPIHKVNKARILVRLGQWNEAEQMIQKAEAQGIREERSIYIKHAKDVLAEIQGCRQAEPLLGRLYLDWRWLRRYRACINYDVFGWLSHSGPFTMDEEAEWNRLFSQRENETARQTMANLIKRARDRELEAAREEHREPCLCYPAIPIEELMVRRQLLDQLAQDIEHQETNVLIKKLYLDAIAEQQEWLRLAHATASGDSEMFWQASRNLYAETTPDEMQLALSHLGMLIAQGKRREKTAAVSQTLADYLQEWQLSGYITHIPTQQSSDQQSSLSTTHADQRKVSPQVIKRFFEEVFRLYHIPGWRVILDRAANNLRIEQNVRALILSDVSEMSVARVRELLSHEIECHVLRSVRGELSPLGLLGVGTRGALFMEEALALHFDNQVAQKIHGTIVDDSTPSTWLGTLAIGLASGILATPRTFAETLPFFEHLYYLIRLLADETEDTEKAWEPARRLAVNRCLRTYRGVPNLETKGICFTKDVVYLRGYRKLAEQVQQDVSIIDRLLVGITGLEQLSELAELGIVFPEVRPQWLAHRPDLDEYILSFQ